MVHRIALTKARINLGQLVRRAHLDKDYFILEKDGIPVAGIMDADEMEDYLDIRDPEVQRQIRASNEDFRAGRTRPADMLLAEFRKERPAKAPQRRKVK